MALCQSRRVDVELEFVVQIISNQVPYEEHINALTKPHVNSKFADHLLITGHTYDNVEHNMEILHTLPKSHKLNTTEQFEIYKHHKQNKSHILNDQIHFHTHTHSHRHTSTPYSQPKTIEQLLTPTSYHHKQPHNIVKTLRTPVQHPHVATDGSAIPA